MEFDSSQSDLPIARTQRATCSSSGLWPKSEPSHSKLSGADGNSSRGPRAPIPLEGGEQAGLDLRPEAVA